MNLKASIHLRNQDEIPGFDQATRHRFESLYHHRDPRYLPSRVDRELSHGPKTISKSVHNSSRTSTIRTASPNHLHPDVSITKEQHGRGRSSSKNKSQPSPSRTDQRTTSPTDIQPEGEMKDHIVDVLSSEFF